MSLFYQDIQYQLDRSNRKTASVTIERDGTVVVRVPEKINSETIEKLLEQKREWIYKRLTEWQSLNRPQRRKNYVNGESFMYLGRVYRLEIITDSSSDLTLHGQYFYLRAGVKNPAQVFKDFYRIQGQKIIQAQVAYFAPLLGLPIKKVRVLDLQYRWASCSQTTLNFHWKVAMTSLSIIDYLVVHELCHFLHSRHDTDFWNTVQKILPNYLEQKSWLKQHGADLVLPESS